MRKNEQSRGVKGYKSHVDHCGLPARATRATAGGDSPHKEKFWVHQLWLTAFLRRVYLLR